MKKTVVVFILLSFVCLPIFSQQPILRDVIYLKNGEKYIGEIVLKTEQIIMIQTIEGKKFQFQTAEISEIKQEDVKPGEKSGQVYNPSGNFAGLFQLSGGLSSIKGAVTTSPTVDLSLAFGTKKAFGKNLFLGGGAGFKNIIDGNNQRSLSFLPLFVQIKNIYSDKNVSPATNIKLGYAFPLQKSYSGGLYLYTSGGISIKTTENSNIYFGLHVQLQSTYGNITETLPQGTFTSKSNAVISDFGITTAFVF